MNTYSTSDGTRYTQSQIEKLITKAKATALERQFDEYRYNFCEECGKNGSGTYLDCSHEISVKKAKENGMAEQCWNVGNIVIRCRQCHKKHDKLI